MALTSWTSTDGTTLALDGSEGVKLQRGVDGVDSPRMSLTLDSRVNDGAVLVNRRRPERPFTLPLLVDTDVISIGAVARIFQSGALTASSGRQLRSVEYSSGLEGMWTVDAGGVEGLTHRKFPLQLVALDPWWYGPLEVQDGTFGAPTPWDAAIPWDSAIPWNGGASEAIVNDGDAPTPVIVVVKGAATSVSMSVNGVGGWETAEPILSAAYLTVSGDTGRRGPHRGPHGAFSGADGPIDWSLLTEQSQLFELPVGSSSLVFGASGADANTAWNAFWAPRYLTP